MKRLLAVLACLALASPALALKPRRVPRHLATGASSSTVTISGSPLTIVVGGDTSMQVYDSNVPGSGQFFPPDCNAGETADSGVFVSSAGVVYGPDFANHPCGSATPGSFVPVAPISLSAVAGSGSAGDPFTVVVVANVGTLMQLTETITYVDGNTAAKMALSFAPVAPPGVTEGGIAFNAFVGADLFLADNDSGFPFATAPSAAGSHGASEDCTELQYTIAFQGTTPASDFTANGFGEVWNEIAAGALADTSASTCLDDGAALEWHENLGGSPVTIQTGVSFTGQAVPVGGIVPALSLPGLVALVALLAVVGYVLAKKSSLGA
jgi:hypothetical protein